MPFLFLLIPVLFFVVGLVIALITNPIDTMQRVGSWACNFIGIMALVFFLLYIFYADDTEPMRVGKIVMCGAVMVVAAGVGGWLRDRRLRNHYIRDFRVQEEALAVLERHRR
ncbi:hypothetical protein [Jonesia quinghaiensis]|uniref:hypothetical protein n=1 Tax=Jonesia quinghaiensis TaxID=262806 RepID=UPI000491E5D3|nr:hypothetical protein [Jonesia quinghaiensis]